MKRFIRTIAVSFALSVVAASAADAERGFTNLFNGKDLTGWEGNLKLWSVQDGTITGKTGTNADNKITHNTFLVWTNADVDDFELRFSYRIVGGNSGVQYRSQVKGQGPFGPRVAGYQADFEAGKTYSGILYEEGGTRGILAARGEKVAWGDDCKKKVVGKVGDSAEIQAKIKHEDWNDYVIIARDHRLRHYINGMLTIDVLDDCEEKHEHDGVLALQIHQGPPMTVQFRDIRFKELE